MQRRWRGDLQGRCLRVLVAVAILVTGRDSFLSAIEIPPQPAIDGHGKFVHDLAYQLAGSQEEMIQIAAIQEVAFEEHDVPIIVVTIDRMSAYGYTGTDIQPFAKQWFNAWEIGTMDRPGGHNRGILVLVSVKDRKGRIELGGDWGYRYDRTCQDIMDNLMIPHFKSGDYAAGLAAGVEGLGELAAVGPQGTAPRFRSRSKPRTSRRSKSSDNPLSAFCAFILIGIIILGQALGIIPRGSGGGGGYSGGGFSGGSSGGGGASGSW